LEPDVLRFVDWLAALQPITMLQAPRAFNVDPELLSTSYVSCSHNCNEFLVAMFLHTNVSSGSRGVQVGLFSLTRQTSSLRRALGLAFTVR
jgi:hypothetical protein